MYRGYNLELEKRYFNKDDDEYYQIGRRLHNKNKKQVKATLESFISSDFSLNGSKMQANWFPQIDADIFISHSHSNEKMAIRLAGWLSHRFNITSFIDSCVWGYANDLIDMINNEYCLIDKKNRIYDYEKCNYSASHVHMMLSTALTMMIDKTECLFFLNTPQSITPSDVIDVTKSPWIYSEVSMTKLIREKSLKKHRQMKRYSSFFEDMKKAVTIKYGVDLSHLTILNEDLLDLWDVDPCSGNVESLDVLYGLT